MREIELDRGCAVIVDDDMFELLNQWKWRISDSGYACRRGTQKDGDKEKKTIWMHREVLRVPEGLVGDHIDGNKLDNRRDNLRICMSRQNNSHVTKRRIGAQNYKGVYRDAHGYWVAHIGHLRADTYLGYYASEEEAAIAYNRKAREIWGEFAVLNPIEDRDIMPLSFSRRNTSGVRYVSWDKARNKWGAQLYRDRKIVHLGRHETLEAAANAVKQYLESEAMQCKS